jgi:hypothetical protein
MRRSYKLFVTLSYSAVLTAPAVAYAQAGDRPATQLFLMPTARALPKGQGYFKAIGMGMPSWQGGITDRLSVGLAVPIYGLGQVVVLTPKFQVQRSEKHSTSVGAIGVLTTGGSINILYVAHTIERETGAIHVTVIKPLNDFFSEPRAISLMVGAEHRVNDRVSFMTENYLFAYAKPVFSGGFRIKAPHTTWDLGLLVPTFLYGARPTPMINVGYKF